MGSWNNAPSIGSGVGEWTRSHGWGKSDRARIVMQIRHGVSSGGATNEMYWMFYVYIGLMMPLSHLFWALSLGSSLCKKKSIHLI